MKKMTTYKHLLRLFILPLLLFAATITEAQTVTTMVNGDTVIINACQQGSGDIYDDGGPTDNYSDNFNGYVLLQGAQGVNISITGTYTTESCCDRLWISDGTSMLVDGVAGSGTVNVTITTGSALIRFNTDGSAIYQGINLHWEIVGGISTICPNQVSGLNASNIGTTSATLSWSSTVPTASFRIGYDNNIINGVSGTSTTLTNLNPNTYYTFHVEPDSPTSTYCCADEISFRTQCGTATLPFTENFEGYNELAFPSCWLMKTNFDQDDAQPSIAAAQHYDGLRSLMLSCGADNENGHFGMVVSPIIADLTDGDFITFSLMSSHNYTQVVIGSCDSVSSEMNNYGFVPFDTITINNSNRWTIYTIPWHGAVNGCRLAFMMRQSMQSYIGQRLYIDNLAIEQCGVQALNVSQTDETDLWLEWSNLGAPACTVTVRRANSLYVEQTITNATSPLHITGLAPSTVYTLTVHPSCGSTNGIARSIQARTSDSGTPAEGFCAEFRSNSLDPDWAFYTNTASSSSFSPYSSYLQHYRYDYNGQSPMTYMVSPRLSGLAGKTVAIVISSNYISGVPLYVGTTRFIDDTANVVILDTVNIVDYYGSTDTTIIVHIPDTSTGRHLVLGFHGNGGYSYSYYYISGLQIGSRVLGDNHILHSYGTQVELHFGGVYDTVMVNYRPYNNSYAWQTDTFYNTDRGMITGLMSGWTYEFICYRAGAAPCPARTLYRETHYYDYTTPYCEQFDEMSSGNWNYYNWYVNYSTSNRPRINSFYADPYHYTQGLEMASWGFDWSYYSSIVLPSIENTKGKLLSFYFIDNAPQSTIEVNYLADRSRNYTDRSHSIDTIHINSQNTRRHYFFQLPNDSTMMDNRIELRYKHSDQYSLWRAFIDDVNISDKAYGNMSVVSVNVDTVTLGPGVLLGDDPLYEATLDIDTLVGTDSIEIAIGDTSNHSVIYVSELHNYIIRGLIAGMVYKVYLKPLPDGCYSYAGYFTTPKGCPDTSYTCYPQCFNFDGMISIDLPRKWVRTLTGVQITNDDHLQIAPDALVLWNPLTSVDGYDLNMQAVGSTPNDTLLIGYVPVDSVPLSTAYFNPALMTAITVFDTIMLDTIWNYYSNHMVLPGVDSLRLCLIPKGGTVMIDNIGLSTCPEVHFTVDGNSIVSTIDGGAKNYYIYVTDSAGTESHTVLVRDNPHHLQNLKMDTKYYVTYNCLFEDSSCTPTFELRTTNSVPLPYCVDIYNTEDYFEMPATWNYICNNPLDSLSITMDGPSIYAPYENSWAYIIMPKFAADSALSMSFHYYCGYSDREMQIGTMSNPNDTSTFIPLEDYSNNSGWIYQDLSDHCDKNIAIRYKKTYMYIRNIHFYGIPLLRYGLLAADRVKVYAEHSYPHYLNIYNNYNSASTQWVFGDTTDYIFTWSNDGSTLYITPMHDTNSYSCDAPSVIYLTQRYALPRCFPDWLFYTSMYKTYGSYHSPTYRIINYQSEAAFHSCNHRQDVEYWLMPDFEIDSIKRASISFNLHSHFVGDSLVVGITTDAYDTSTFIPVDTVVYTDPLGDWQRVSVNFESYADTGRWITMRHQSGQCTNCGDGDFMYMDDLYISACAAATAKATLWRWNIVRIDATSADSVLAVPFYARCVNYDTNGSQVTNILRVDTVPMFITLDQETQYDFNFTCDSLGYTCMPDQIIKTLAAPLAVPSCINFDTMTLNKAPHNWEVHNGAIAVTNKRAHSGAKSLDIPTGLHSYIAAPDIDIDSLKHLAVSLWFLAENKGDKLVVGTMASPTDLGSFHPIRTLSTIDTGSWQHELIDLTNAPADHHYLAFRARNNRSSVNSNIYLDDIYLSDCGAFNLKVQNVDFDAITLDWYQVGTPDITIEVKDNGSVIRTIVPTTHPTTITPLSKRHKYTFVFTSTCDDSSSFCTMNYTDSITLVTPSEGTGCVNFIDLYSPQATFFKGSYPNPYSYAGAVDYGSTHPDSRHTVQYDTAARDPRTDNQLRTIPMGYDNSVRLGNWTTNSESPEAEGVIYSLFVDTNSFQMLLMNYAAVLQDPQHARSDQPRFRLELLDSTFHLIDSACTSADFIADQSLGWHTADDGVLWKDWTSVGIDISAHANEQVYVRLTTFDCNEGSHYGYAYFTLECREKQIETTSCGDVITNTLTAPAGFVYRWYKSTSPTTVGTTQSIVIPSEDVTYYCDLSFIDNPACTFTLSAYGGTRYPMASFDTAMYIDSCRFYMTFTNTSAISNDHVNNLPGTTCENAYWDFGNGQTSTNYHASTKYLLPGTYTVMLVSSIADGECSDTAYMTFNLVLPLELMPSDTLVSSICDNQTQLFYDTSYNQPGTFYHITPTGDFCDSLNVLQLDVRLTSNSDTTAIACDSIRWRGALYTASGVYVSGAIGLNAANCDSTRTLHLTVNPTYDTVDTIIVCPWRPYMYRDIDFGGPATFDTALLTIKDCDSVVHVVIRPRDTTFHIAAYHTFGSNVHWKAVDSIIFGCAPDTLHLVDSTANAFNRLWEFYIQDTVAYADSNVTRFDWVFQHSSDSLAAVAVLKVESEGHCWDTAAWPIVMLQRPYAQFEWAPTNPPLHDPEARFINLTYEPEPLRYLWNIQEVVGGAFDTSTAREPSYHWGQPGDDVTGDYVIKLCAYWDHVLDTLLHGDWYDSSVSIYHYLLPTLQFPITHTCLDSTDNVITITNDFLQFPNLVTPNGDGNNDIWKVVNLVEFGEYSMNELWIFDRWGVLIYHVKNISTDADFWDPNATNSPDGTYYYRFQARSLFGLVKRNGLIEVLRN